MTFWICGNRQHLLLEPSIHEQRELSCASNIISHMQFIYIIYYHHVYPAYLQFLKFLPFILLQK